MIRRTLEGNNINLSSVYFIPVPDILMNNVWVYHVKSFTPKFDVVISRNPLVIRLFKEAGYEVLEPPAYNRSLYNSTLIRRLMIENNKEWEKLVPQEVLKFIYEIRGDERLRSIAGLS